MHQKTIAALIASVLVIGVAVLGVTAGLGTVGADTQATAENQTITVDATGEAEAAPDEAVVRVGVTADGDDPGAIRDDLATDADELRDALDELGVEYETDSYGIQEAPRHRQEEFDSQYAGHHSFKVTADDPEMAGDIIEAAASVGGEVDDVELTLSDETREELRDEAIEDAMDDARHQADTIAGTTSLDVVGATNVDATQSGYSAVSVEYAVEEDASGASAARTAIDSGDVSVTYDVRVTYNATSG